MQPALVPTGRHVALLFHAITADFAPGPARDDNGPSPTCDDRDLASQVHSLQHIASCRSSVKVAGHGCPVPGKGQNHQWPATTARAGVAVSVNTRRLACYCTPYEIAAVYQDTSRCALAEQVCKQPCHEHGCVMSLRCHLARVQHVCLRAGREVTAFHGPHSFHRNWQSRMVFAHTTWSASGRLHAAQRAYLSLVRQVQSARENRSQPGNEIRSTNNLTHLTNAACLLLGNQKTAKLSLLLYSSPDEQ